MWRDLSEWFGRWQHRSMPVPVRFFPANGSVGNTARHGVFSVVVANIPMGATGAPRGREGSPPAIESSAQGWARWNVRFLEGLTWSRGIFRVTASTSALRLATALAPRPRFFRSPGRAFFFVRTAIVVSSPRSPLVAWFRRDGMVRVRFLLEDPGFGSPPAVDACRTRRWESRHAFLRLRDGPRASAGRSTRWR